MPVADSGTWVFEVGQDGKGSEDRVQLNVREGDKRSFDNPGNGMPLNVVQIRVPPNESERTPTDSHEC